MAAAAAGPTTNYPVAYAWMRRADFLGVAEARGPANEIWAGLSAAETTDAEAMASAPHRLIGFALAATLAAIVTGLTLRTLVALCRGTIFRPG